MCSCRTRRREPSKHRPNHKRAQKGQDSSKPTPNFVLASAPQLSWLMVRDADTLGTEEALVFRHLSQHREFVFMCEHAKAFQKMVCQREAGGFDACLATSSESDIARLKTFAEGLSRDYAEVRAALELPWSNGQTEGQVNKLKHIKLQMYRRANFDLLRQRVLLAA